MSLRSHLTLSTPLGAVLSDSRIRLLEAIEQHGSLSRAARAVPLSYKAAWDALDSLDNLSPEALVERSTGGPGGGGTRLTDYARRLIALYRALERSQQDLLDRLDQIPQAADAATLRTLLRRLSIKTSARNQYAARVSGLLDRGGLIEVRLALDSPSGTAPTLAATVTPESVETLDLRLGSEVFALLKAPAVQLHPAAPAPAAGLNLLPGQIAELRPGRERCGVALSLSCGLSLHAVVDAATAATLQPGLPVWAGFGSEQIVLVSVA